MPVFARAPNDSREKTLSMIVPESLTGVSGKEMDFENDAALLVLKAIKRRSLKVHFSHEAKDLDDLKLLQQIFDFEVISKFAAI